MKRRGARRTFAQGGRPWLRCSLCKRYRVGPRNGAYCLGCVDAGASVGWLALFDGRDVCDPELAASLRPRAQRPKLDEHGRQLHDRQGLIVWEDTPRLLAPAV